MQPRKVIPRGPAETVGHARSTAELRPRGPALAAATGCVDHDEEQAGTADQTEGVSSTDVSVDTVNQQVTCTARCAAEEKRRPRLSSKRSPVCRACAISFEVVAPRQRRPCSASDDDIKKQVNAAYRRSCTERQQYHRAVRE